MTSLRTIWHKIVHAGITDNLPIEQRKKVNLANHITFLGTIVLLCYALVNAFFGIYFLTLINLVIAITTFTAYWMNKIGWYKTGKFFYFYAFCIELLAFPYFVGNIGAEYYCFPILISGFYLFDGRRNLFVLSFFVLGIFFSSKYFIQLGTSAPKYEHLEQLFYMPNLIMSMVLSVIAVALFKSDSIRYQQNIEHQNYSLDLQIKKLEQREHELSDLYKELNHRVKNNLQMISGLFSMQSYHYEKSEVKDALNDARHRVDTIAMLHQHLYKNQLSPLPNLKEYLEELSEYVVYAAGNDDKVKLVTNFDNAHLRIEQSVHVGLIVNELLTNSLKYGLSNNTNNTITLSVNKINDNLVIKVKDPGPGFPADFDIKANDTFGLELINAISQQHNGSVKVKNHNGAEVEVRLML